MKAVAVVAVFAAGVVGGGVVAAHEAFKPAEHVQVRYVSPAADATEKAPAPVVKASPAAVPRVKVVKPKPVKRVKVRVPSKKVTTHTATVQRSESDVSEPTPESTILPPPVGPDNRPTEEPPTGVFGGPTTPSDG